MPFLEPATVRKVRRGFEPAPTLIPTSAPEAVIVQPTPTPVRQNGTASGAGSRTTATRSPTRSPKTGAAAAGSSAGGSSAVPPDANSTPYGVPEAAKGSSGGTNAPRIGDTSPDASLRPLWPGLYEIVAAFI